VRLTQADTAHIAAIGAVAMMWNEVEIEMELLTWALAGWNQKMGELVTREMGSQQLVTLARHMVRHRGSSDEATNQVEDICNLFESIRVRRNDLLHSLGPTAKDRTHRKRSAKTPSGAVKVKIVEADLKSIESLIDDMMTFRRLCVPLAMLNRANPPALSPVRELEEKHIDFPKKLMEFLKPKRH